MKKEFKQIEGHYNQISADWFRLRIAKKHYRLMDLVSKKLVRVGFLFQNDEHQNHIMHSEDFCNKQLSLISIWIEHDLLNNRKDEMEALLRRK